MTFTPDTFANFASSNTTVSLAIGDTVIPVTNGTGARFPSSGPAMLLIGDPAATYELVKMTSRSGDSLTVVRGAEGTTATTWASGAAISAVATAGNFSNINAALNSHDSSITTLNSEMTTADNNISTLQSQMSTANSNISTNTTNISNNTTSINNLVSSLPFNVKHYGAVGDGVTDDTNAIAQAISAAFQNGQITATPPAPSGTSNSGTATATGITYFAAGDVVKVGYSYWNGRGETLVGPTTSFTVVTAKNEIILTVPSSFPSGVLGINVYVSVSAGSSTLGRNEWSRVQASIMTPGGTFTIQGYPKSSDDEAPEWNTTGGGEVDFPGGIYITGPMTVYPNVHYRGAGSDATILRLKATTTASGNYDLFNGGSTNLGFISIYTSGGSGAEGRLYDWSIRNMTLDGNKDNVSGTSFTSYCLRVYADNYILDDIKVERGYSGGILSDWNGNDFAWPDAMETYWTNVKVHDCGGVGVTWAGPHDSQWLNVIVYDTDSHCVYVGPHAYGLQATNVHFWHPGMGTTPPSVGLFLDTDTGQNAGSHYFYNAEIEGADAVQVVMLTSRCILKGSIYGQSNSNSSAIQFGEVSGATAYAMANPAYVTGSTVNQAINVFGNSIDVRVTSCTSSNGVFWLKGEYYGNSIKAMIWQSNASFFGGTAPANFDLIDISSPAGGPGTNVGLRQSPVNVFSPNPTVLQLTNGGTITNAQTYGLTRVQTSSGANVTGLIMPNGLYNGQVVFLLNENGSYTMTFAAASTSKVLGNATINTLSSACLVWDSGTGYWYRLS